MNHFDAIVIGLGGVGSAALSHLARSGCHVLGLEQFQVGHSLGSSHGETRVIRKAYFEHPSYVPLLKRSYELWDALEKDSGETLFERCGVVQIGPPDGDVIQGVLRSADQHGLEVERLDREQLREKAPMLRLPDGMAALWEEDGGLLHVEACVKAHARDAIRRGATVLQGERVVNWHSDGEGVVVRTLSDRYSADRVLFCAGAWTSSLLSRIGRPLNVLRKVQIWSSAEQPWRHAPVFLYDLESGVFYGFPDCGTGVKVAEHSGGEAVDPNALDRDLHGGDLDRVVGFNQRWLEGLGAPHRHAVCMYTMSPDENFLVGPHPKGSRVFVAAGLSGHGFKFCPVLGEGLAQMMTAGTSSLDFEFLSPSRLGGSL
ncbi:MAG: N-methyl-L-tryptophan oxidase [Myxococcota bacterium]|nr:N-methyl-L-tryptophan oxidase [Myxococcota bacterium]